MDLIKLHPPLVHFAIAFPLMTLIMDLYYRFKKNSPNGLHALLTYLSVISVLMATVSGILAHEPIEDKLASVPVFPFHQSLGLFLALWFLAIGAVRFLMDRGPGSLRNIYTVLLVLGVLLLFVQGRWGGIIVYDYLLKKGL
ncbi:DUF2231 domain-containing protein [Hydrogenobacter hydrogenophilus]|uniref:Uncharacterized membrane protein n=1 Tax=Hydrogenobacter hydrogenophilus TaxID=35835 RepID=A0A285NYQ6_9AQUI|nr:DUF2231 domain-containing protein [Hydrogenobacter hydrogenophilus]SNZ14610.1 Uncharacterized membrane protein [Hydrogenobacter hydrogenophilus]